MVDPDGMAARYNWEKGKYEDGGNEVSFEDALKSVGVSGCPPNCPQNQAKADATQVANRVTPQISDGSIQLPQREQGFIKNADSKLLPHEHQIIDGLAVGLQAAYSEAILAKAIGSIWALRAAKGGGNAFRYMTEAELKAVQNTGLLRGGRAGETFFTKDLYKSAASAQNRLALPSAPTLRVEFQILNNPTLLRNGTKVLPANGMMGRGAEFMTLDPVKVNLINWQPLR
jgi:hypothetical protein